MNCKISRNMVFLSFICAIVMVITACDPKAEKDVESGKEITLRLEPGPGNPRNSEGDFIQLKDGRILFVYTHFTGGSGDHASAYLAGRFSDDGGKTWTTKDNLILPNEGNMNIMSVSLLRLRNNNIALFYLKKNSESDCIPMMRISSDEAMNWSEPKQIIDNIGYYVLNNDRVLQLNDGRLILPVALHKTLETGWSSNAQIICFYSDDEGETWTGSQLIPNPEDILLQEPGIVELKMGELMMFCRTNAGVQYLSFSEDRGKSWSSVEPSEIRSPLSPASIERIPETGDLLMVWNENLIPGDGKRTPFVLAISEDEGRSWERVKYIETDPNGWYCYTAIMFADQHILLGHCAGNRQKYGGLETTQVTRLRLEWVYQNPVPAPAETIDLSENWKFSPDEKNIGLSEKWYAVNYNDSNWETLDAGERWENQGYRDLDSYGWYRKSVDIPADWKGKDIWLKFGAVNDAYELFVNGESVSVFGQANISVANRPTFTEIRKNLKYGESNQIALRVNDWGNSGGLWRLPVILTTDENDVNNIFKPMSPTRHTPESLGYELFWEDQFDGNKLDPKKWAPRALGPRRGGYNSTEAIKVKDGFLELSALLKGDSVLAGAVGTQDLFMTKYGYFECRSQLQKSRGIWAAFWIQSKGISAGEDPGEYGTEIDIFEFFKGFGEDMVSHNLHWAYGPNQQTIGALLSHHEGVSEGFHTIALEWTPEKYAFFVNGYKYHEVTKAISHIEEYMILSMELPGTEELKAAVLPDVFIVDYVKVYKKK